jgi:hypothetical protein
MSFDNETPLSDVVRYIQASTTSAELPNGIPVYLDPLGLAEINVTPESPVRLNLEGVALKRTLFLALRSLKLAYIVQDGLLIISTKECLDDLLSAEPIYGVSQQ